MISRSFLIFTAFVLAIVTARAGAWGHESFANDDAYDWIANSLKPDGQHAVEAAITSVAKGRGYLQSPDACYAIAACEVLAAAQGRPAPDLPAEVVAIAKKLPSKPSESLRKAAREALDRIMGKDSELNEQRKESKEHFEKWRKCVEDLKSRV